MAPFLSARPRLCRTAFVVALLAGLLAAPATAQNPGPGTYTIGAPGALDDTTTTLNSGLVTLTNGTSLNLNGFAVGGGLTGMYRGFFNGYNVLGAGDPQLENLPDARAAFNALGNLGIYAPPPPSTAPQFYRDPTPAPVNYPNANNPNNAFPQALPPNIFDNYVGRWQGELNVTTAGNYTFGTRSDDGSLVYVDGILAVANNRFQGPTTRTNQFLPASTPTQPSANPINLTAGAHRVEVFYYEGGGGSQMQLGYSGPDNGNLALTNGGGQGQMDAAIIPASRLSGYQGRVVLTNDVAVAASGSASINVARAAGVIFNGTLTMNAGSTLTIGSGTLGALAANDGAVYFNSTSLGTGTKTFNTVGDLSLGNVSGSGGTIVKQGVGNLILDGAPLPGGTTVQIQSGQVIAIPELVNNPNPLGAGNTVQIPAGVTTNPTLQLRTQTGQVIYDNPFQVNSNATLELNNNNTVDTASVGIFFPNTTTLANNAVLNLRPASGTTAFFASMGSINGSGTINVSGNALVRLTAANNFTSATPITLGGSSALDVLATSSLGATTNPVTIAGGSTLSIEGTGAGVTVANPITLNSGGAGAVGGVTRAGALESFNGAVTLTGALNFTGSSTIGTRDGGSLTTNSNLPLGANTATFNPTAGAVTIGGVISGTGGVTKTGNGNLILTGNNTYSGATNVNGGTLEARGPSTSAVGTGATNINAGGTLLVTGPNALGNPSGITLNGGTLQFNIGANTATLTTPVTANAGSAINVTSGTVNMPAANINLAPTVIRQGLLERFATNATWPDVNTSPITAFPLTLGANSGAQTTVRMGNFNTVVQGTAPTNWQDNTIFVYTGQIQARTNTLSFAEHVDDNTLVRINTGSGFQNVISDTAWNVPQKTGPVAVTPGQFYDIEIRFFNGGGGAGPTAQGGGATLGWANNYGFAVSDTDTSAAANGLGNVFNATTQPLYFRPGDPVAPAGGIADPLGASRFRFTSPSATLSVAAGASLTAGQLTGGGDVSLAAGSPGAALTLAAANTSAVGSFAVTGTTGSATLTTNAGHTLTVTNLSIPSGTSLTKAGAGTMFVNGAGGTGSGRLDVNAGTVGGTGTIAGALSVNTGGTVAPGTSVGKLTVNNQTTFGPGGTYAFEYASVDQTAISNPANFGVTHDHIAGVGGSASLNVTATNVGASRFTIDITAQTFSPTPTATDYIIGTFPGGISGFTSDKFLFTGTGFSGVPTIAMQGNNLVLTLVPVPEPVHLLVLCAAALGAHCVRRRRPAVRART